MLSLRLIIAVISLIFLVGLVMISILSGLYHGQVMEAHIEEMFFLAEHYLDDHLEGSLAPSGPPGLGFAPVIEGKFDAWFGEMKLLEVTKGIEPQRWNGGGDRPDDHGFFGLAGA